MWFGTCCGWSSPKSLPGVSRQVVEVAFRRFQAPSDLCVSVCERERKREREKERERETEKEREREREKKREKKRERKRDRERDRSTSRVDLERVRTRL